PSPLAMDIGHARKEVPAALEVKRAEALAKAGRGAAAAAAYLLAAGDEVTSRAVDLRRRAAAELVCSGRIDEGNRMFESVLVAVGVRTPTTTFGVIASLLFWLLYFALRGLRFVQRAEDDLDPRAVL